MKASEFINETLEDDIFDFVNAPKDSLDMSSWKNLASGSFADVFSKSGKPYVLKVARADSCYEKFVNLIHKFPNPHFPQVVNIRSTKNGDKMINSYIIEKLNTFNNDDMMDKIFMISSFIDAYGDNNNIPYIHDFNEKYPLLYKAVVILKVNLNHQHCHFDLHSGNIMQRDDGTLVITDPFAPYKK